MIDISFTSVYLCFMRECILANVTLHKNNIFFFFLFCFEFLDQLVVRRMNRQEASATTIIWLCAQEFLQIRQNPNAYSFRRIIYYCVIHYRKSSVAHEIHVKCILW